MSTIKQKFEKLLFWLIPLTVISAAGHFFLKNALKSITVSNGDVVTNSAFFTQLIAYSQSLGDIFLLLGFLDVIPGLVVNLSIAIWLYSDMKDAAGRKWLWFLFGLCLSFWALVIYLLLSILETNKEVATPITSNET